MPSSIIPALRILDNEEALAVVGGDFLVPGPDSTSNPSAQFIMVPYGVPNYDQEDIDAESYYHKYIDYYNAY